MPPTSSRSSGVSASGQRPQQQNDSAAEYYGLYKTARTLARSYQAVAHQKDDQVKALTREMEELKLKLQQMEAAQQQFLQQGVQTAPASQLTVEVPSANSQPSTTAPDSTGSYPSSRVGVPHTARQSAPHSIFQTATSASRHHSQPSQQHQLQHPQQHPHGQQATGRAGSAGSMRRSADIHTLFSAQMLRHGHGTSPSSSSSATVGQQHQQHQQAAAANQAALAKSMTLTNRELPLSARQGPNRASRSSAETWQLQIPDTEEHDDAEAAADGGKMKKAKGKIGQVFKKLVSKSWRSRDDDGKQDVNAGGPAGGSGSSLGADGGRMSNRSGDGQLNPVYEDAEGAGYELYGADLPLPPIAADCLSLAPPPATLPDPHPHSHPASPGSYRPGSNSSGHGITVTLPSEYLLGAPSAQDQLAAAQALRLEKQLALQQRQHHQQQLQSAAQQPPQSILALAGAHQGHGQGPPAFGPGSSSRRRLTQQRSLPARTAGGAATMSVDGSILAAVARRRGSNSGDGLGAGTTAGTDLVLHPSATAAQMSLSGPGVPASGQAACPSSRQLAAAGGGKTIISVSLDAAELSAAAATANAAGDSGRQQTQVQPAAGGKATGGEGGGMSWANLIQRAGLGQVAQRIKANVPGVRKSVDSAAGTSGGGTSTAVFVGSARQSWASDTPSTSGLGGMDDPPLRSSAPATRSSFNSLNLRAVAAQLSNLPPRPDGSRAVVPPHASMSLTLRSTSANGLPTFQPPELEHTGAAAAPPNSTGGHSDGTEPGRAPSAASGATASSNMAIQASEPSLSFALRPPATTTASFGAAEAGVATALGCYPLQTTAYLASSSVQVGMAHTSAARAIGFNAADDCDGWPSSGAAGVNATATAAGNNNSSHGPDAYLNSILGRLKTPSVLMGSQPAAAHTVAASWAGTLSQNPSTTPSTGQQGLMAARGLVQKQDGGAMTGAGVGVGSGLAPGEGASGDDEAAVAGSGARVFEAVETSADDMVLRRDFARGVGVGWRHKALSFKKTMPSPRFHEKVLPRASSTPRESAVSGTSHDSIPPRTTTSPVKQRQPLEHPRRAPTASPRTTAEVASDVYGPAVFSPRLLEMETSAVSATSLESTDLRSPQPQPHNPGPTAHPPPVQSPPLQYPTTTTVGYQTAAHQLQQLQQLQSPDQQHALEVALWRSYSPSARASARASAHEERFLSPKSRLKAAQLATTAAGRENNQAVVGVSAAAAEAAAEGREEARAGTGGTNAEVTLSTQRRKASTVARAVATLDKATSNKAVDPNPAASPAAVVSVTGDASEDKMDGLWFVPPVSAGGRTGGTAAAHNGVPGRGHCAKVHCRYAATATDGDSSSGPSTSRSGTWSTDPSPREPPDADCIQVTESAGLVSRKAGVGTRVATAATAAATATAATVTAAVVAKPATAGDSRRDIVRRTSLLLASSSDDTALQALPSARAGGALTARASAGTTDPTTARHYLASGNTPPTTGGSLRSASLAPSPRSDSSVGSWDPKSGGGRAQAVQLVGSSTLRQRAIEAALAQKPMATVVAAGGVGSSAGAAAGSSVTATAAALRLKQNLADAACQSVTPVAVRKRGALRRRSLAAGLEAAGEEGVNGGSLNRHLHLQDDTRRPSDGGCCYMASSRGGSGGGSCEEPTHSGMDSMDPGSRDLQGKAAGLRTHRRWKSQGEELRGSYGYYSADDATHALHQDKPDLAWAAANSPKPHVGATRPQSSGAPSNVSTVVVHVQVQSTQAAFPTLAAPLQPATASSLQLASADATSRVASGGGSGNVTHTIAAGADRMSVGGSHGRVGSPGGAAMWRLQRHQAATVIQNHWRASRARRAARALTAAAGRCSELLRQQQQQQQMMMMMQARGGSGMRKASDADGDLMRAAAEAEARIREEERQEQEQAATLIQKAWRAHRRLLDKEARAQEFDGLDLDDISNFDVLSPISPLSSPVRSNATPAPVGPEALSPLSTPRATAPACGPATGASTPILVLHPLSQQQPVCVRLPSARLCTSVGGAGGGGLKRRLFMQRRASVDGSLVDPSNVAEAAALRLHILRGGGQSDGGGLDSMRSSLAAGEGPNSLGCAVIPQFILPTGNSADNSPVAKAKNGADGFLSPPISCSPSPRTRRSAGGGVSATAAPVAAASHAIPDPPPPQPSPSPRTHRDDESFTDLVRHSHPTSLLLRQPKPQAQPQHPSQRLDILLSSTVGVTFPRVLDDDVVNVTESWQPSDRLLGRSPPRATQSHAPDPEGPSHPVLLPSVSPPPKLSNKTPRSPLIFRGEVLSLAKENNAGSSAAYVNRRRSYSGALSQLTGAGNTGGKAQERRGVSASWDCFSMLGERRPTESANQLRKSDGSGTRADVALLAELAAAAMDSCLGTATTNITTTAAAVAVTMAASSNPALNVEVKQPTPAAALAVAAQGQTMALESAAQGTPTDKGQHVEASSAPREATHRTVTPAAPQAQQPAQHQDAATQTASVGLSTAEASLSVSYGRSSEAAAPAAATAVRAEDAKDAVRETATSRATAAKGNAVAAEAAAVAGLVVKTKGPEGDTVSRFAPAPAVAATGAATADSSFAAAAGSATATATATGSAAAAAAAGTTAAAAGTTAATVGPADVQSPLSSAQQSSRSSSDRDEGRSDLSDIPTDEDFGNLGLRSSTGNLRASRISINLGSPLDEDEDPSGLRDSATLASPVRWHTSQLWELVNNQQQTPPLSGAPLSDGPSLSRRSWPCPRPTPNATAGLGSAVGMGSATPPRSLRAAGFSGVPLRGLASAAGAVNVSDDFSDIVTDAATDDEGTTGSRRRFPPAISIAATVAAAPRGDPAGLCSELANLTSPVRWHTSQLWELQQLVPTPGSNRDRIALLTPRDGCSIQHIARRSWPGPVPPTSAMPPLPTSRSVGKGRRPELGDAGSAASSAAATPAGGNDGGPSGDAKGAGTAGQAPVFGGFSLIGSQAVLSLPAFGPKQATRADEAVSRRGMSLVSSKPTLRQEARKLEPSDSTLAPAAAQPPPQPHNPGTPPCTKTVADPGAAPSSGIPTEPEPSTSPVVTSATVKSGRIDVVATRTTDDILMSSCTAPAMATADASPGPQKLSTIVLADAVTPEARQQPQLRLRIQPLSGGLRSVPLSIPSLPSSVQSTPVANKSAAGAASRGFGDQRNAIASHGTDAVGAASSTSPGSGVAGGHRRHNSSPQVVGPNDRINTPNTDPDSDASPRLGLPPNRVTSSANDDSHSGTSGSGVFFPLARRRSTGSSSSMAEQKTPCSSARPLAPGGLALVEFLREQQLLLQSQEQPGPWVSPQTGVKGPPPPTSDREETGSGRHLSGGGSRVGRDQGDDRGSKTAATAAAAGAADKSVKEQVGQDRGERAGAAPARLFTSSVEGVREGALRGSVRQIRVLVPEGETGAVAGSSLLDDDDDDLCLSDGVNLSCESSDSFY